MCSFPKPLVSKALKELLTSLLKAGTPMEYGVDMYISIPACSRPSLSHCQIESLNQSCVFSALSTQRL